MSSRILVTGGHGFIGRRVVERLRASGFPVDAPTRFEWDVAGGSFSRNDADVVIHLAGRTFVPVSWSEPAAFYQTNAMGTVNVLEHCRRCGARLVNLAGFAYGAASVLPTPESEPLKPENPYALSKVAAEEACHFYRQSFGLSVITLRVFNVYGPGQSQRMLIPSIIDQVLDPGCAAISVADSSVRRDLVHVDDVVAAIVAAALRTAPSAAAYNVGSGRSHSVGEIVEMANAAAGTQKPLVDRGERRPNEIPDTAADIGAIHRDFGWQPTITLRDGLRRLIAERLAL